MSSSTSSSTSSLFTPLQFTGISQYSSDFQSILSRSTSIAELPVQALQNTVTTITQEETDLSSLGTAASAVGTALQTLGNLSTGQALSATSSDDSVVTATATGASAGTSYNITNVTSIASAASETSTTGYSDASSTAVSSTGSMQLAVGSNTYKITLASGQNNLNGLVSAINNLGAGVTASVLTTGGTSGDYLSVTANSTGATTLTLIDDPTGTTPTDVLTDSNQGSNTNFDLNGVAVSSSSATVNNVIPGLVLNFAGTTSASETVNVNVAVDSSQISSALQTLVSNYNTLTADENTEMGTGGGSLVGNNIVYQIRQAMSDIVDYEGDNSQGVGNLSALGIEINESGQMTFNQQTFDALTTSQISSGLQLLGNSTTGIGGLQQVFNQITDPADGTIAEQQSQWQTTATNLTNEISTKVAQIQANEQTLDQQLQAADASVADLATQQTTLSAEITSLDYTSYGYNTNINSSQAT
jgi:flagellar hook-associated protein 2